MEEKRIGRQEPTSSFILPYKKTEGETAVALYELTGRTALDWQKALVYDILAQNDDGLWTHTKFGYSIPRRNGKGEVLIIIELYALAKGERVLHTAHRTTTSHSAYERIVDLLEAAGLEKDHDFYASKALGLEKITLPNGGLINFRTRTTKGGLGEGYDLLIIDEAQEYQTTHETTLKYVVTDSKNPHTILCGTPPTVVSSGTVFKDFRKTVLQGNTQNAGWAEWSVDDISNVKDVDLWYETNPSLGLTLAERSIFDELGSSDESRIDFNIQRLGLWLEYNQKSAISRVVWENIQVEEMPKLVGKIAVGIKYNRDGTSVSVAVAAKTDDDRIFTEVVGRSFVRDGNAWILNFIKSIDKSILKVVVDGVNGQNILKDEMKDLRLKEPVLPSVKQVIEANQRFENNIYQERICHMEQPSLTAVISDCDHRAIGSAGGFGWKPLDDLRDISLMEAASLACWTIESFKQTNKQIISY